MDDIYISLAGADRLQFKYSSHLTPFTPFYNCLHIVHKHFLNFPVISFFFQNYESSNFAGFVTLWRYVTFDSLQSPSR